MGTTFEVVPAEFPKLEGHRYGEQGLDRFKFQNNLGSTQASCTNIFGVAIKIYELGPLATNRLRDPSGKG